MRQQAGREELIKMEKLRRIQETENIQVQNVKELIQGETIQVPRDLIRRKEEKEVKITQPAEAAADHLRNLTEEKAVRTIPAAVTALREAAALRVRTVIIQVQAVQEVQAVQAVRQVQVQGQVRVQAADLQGEDNL